MSNDRRPDAVIVDDPIAGEPEHRERTLARWHSLGPFAEVRVRLRDPREGENVSTYPLALRVVTPTGDAEIPLSSEHAADLGRELLRLAARDGTSCTATAGGSEA
ncbi:hypothetical protein [Sandaracinus amylolyticus]|uniref:hypothetical protein n=1 Tax=Sandaracinus amylolyticus TaxID=927083 RepID=UPI001F1C1A24|nr:hypothetical protein [Sandaracinus amylolyticus]UJR81509.1 Hypothetical protein I5071_35690 [Sandaracinus amylolyticus]